MNPHHSHHPCLQLTVGRKGHVDIVCNGKTVSRLHCELLYHDNRWYIMDLDVTDQSQLNEPIDLIIILFCLMTEPEWDLCQPEEDST